MSIDTDKLSVAYRDKIIDVAGQRLLMARIAGSAQEGDLTEPPNIEGLGRVRHFRRRSSERWVPNPLPIDPACARLGIPRCEELNSQVFQNAACNWRCWYCFVPFDLLAASPSKSQWVTAHELVDRYSQLRNRPPVLDLSGGQPELTPEWVVWTMDALEAHGLEDAVYLWSDDNLSNDYFWRYLTPQQRARVSRYRNYGRVACFKGIDDESFAFNTGADSSLFDRQFELFRRYIAEGVDIYAYVTLTHVSTKPITDLVRRFVDRLQQIDTKLPLRTVPLEIAEFGPVTGRLDNLRRGSMRLAQYEALAAWCSEIEKRFSAAERRLAIQDVSWAGQ